MASLLQLARVLAIRWNRKKRDQAIVCCSHLFVCPQVNPETAADLVTSLDNFGFDLERDFVQGGDVTENEVQRNLAFQMHRVNFTKKQRQENLIFQQNKSRIVLPRAIFAEVHTQHIET